MPPSTSTSPRASPSSSSATPMATTPAPSPSPSPTSPPSPSPPPSPTPSSSASGTTPTRALLFFRSLLHLSRRHDHGHGHGHLAPSASRFDLALDLAARLRDRCRVHSLLLRRRRLLPRLAPSPRTFSLLAERLVLSGKPDRAIRLFLSSSSSLHTPCTFNSILDALSKSRRVHKASRRPERCLTKCRHEASSPTSPRTTPSSRMI